MSDPLDKFLGHNSGETCENAENEEAYYHKTAFHDFFFSDST